MLTTMAASLLGLLVLGLVNGSATGDVVPVLCSASAMVLVLFRLRDESELGTSPGIPPPRTARGRVSPHGTQVRMGEIKPA